MSDAFQGSWIETANTPGCGFPLQNLPFCAFGSDNEQHLGVGIGDSILDLAEASRRGLLANLSPDLSRACMEPTLNRLIASGKLKTSELRNALISLLADDAAPHTTAALKPLLRPMSNTEFRVPVAIGNYTDFYASIHHATNVGRLFRPDQPLLPNYKWLPIGYHGRASSIVISGTPVVRPSGQSKAPTSDEPVFGPSKQLDYELELGAYVAEGNVLGNPIAIEDAERRLFGVSLVNDWSARDIQAWEYQPLGPFLGKSFATSVSPWVVTMEALRPYRVALAARASGDPAPLPYLASGSSESEALDVQLEVYLSSRAMREASIEPMRISSGNARELYWSFAQMVAHHSSNGCNLQTGDLLASGTISGPEDGSQGCLLEITQRGAKLLRLPSGEERAFLEDGDEITLRGFCEREGFPRIGLGECKGMVVPASLAGRADVARH